MDDSLARLDAGVGRGHSKEVLVEALGRLCGAGTRAPMSIPPRPTDADLVLGAAIDDLVEARALLARIAGAADERDAARRHSDQLRRDNARRPMHSEELQHHLAQARSAGERLRAAWAELEEALAEARKAVQR